MILPHTWEHVCITFLVKTAENSLKLVIWLNIHNMADTLLSEGHHNMADTLLSEGHP